MWTRADLKRRAKDGLRQYYGCGLLVAFVSVLLGSKASGGLDLSARQNHGSHPAAMEFPLALGLILVVGLATIVFLVITLLFSIFVCNVVEVGRCRYFTISTLAGDDAGFGELFGNFKAGRYLNTVKIQFLRKLYEGLWSLLLVIPGIIKHYEYYMVPYLVAEYPEMESQEVFRRSREMMDGNKFDTWVLELSFLGWYLLGVLACGIGIFFVLPYPEAVFAELYLALREERLGIPRERTHMPDRDGSVYTQRGY